MISIILTIGLGIHEDERPQRWLGIIPIYMNLATGLRACGFNVDVVIDRAVANESGEGVPDSFSVIDSNEFEEICAKNNYDIGFIWGGRIPSDLETVKIFTRYKIKTIFSELGWIPQKGTIYFDKSGTNGYASSPELLGEIGLFAKIFFSIKRNIVAKKIYNRSVFSKSKKLEKISKIFVPLQDENDTNISIDSPFKTMDEFVSHLSEKYKESIITIRIHPLAIPRHLGTYSNVIIQEPSENPWKKIEQYDLIIGINSTFLTEAAFLGHKVVVYGQGIARKFNLGLAVNLEDKALSSNDIPNIKPSVPGLHKLFKRQMQQKKLSNSKYLQRSHLWKLLHS